LPQDRLGELAQLTTGEERRALGRALGARGVARAAFGRAHLARRGAVDGRIWALVLAVRAMRRVVAAYLAAALVVVLGVERSGRPAEAAPVLARVPPGLAAVAWLLGHTLVRALAQLAARPTGTCLHEGTPVDDAEGDVRAVQVGSEARLRLGAVADLAEPTFPRGLLVAPFLGRQETEVRSEGSAIWTGRTIAIAVGVGRARLRDALRGSHLMARPVGRARDAVPTRGSRKI